MTTTPGTDEPVFYSVRALRTDLREAIDRAKTGTPVVIGAHGQPEVAMTAVGGSRMQLIDSAALETLLCLVGPSTIQLIEQSRLAAKGAFAIPDNFGRVLDWLWASGRRDRAVLLVADLLADVRAADLATQPTYETFLRMVRLSLTSDDDTRSELIGYLDQRIVGYYSKAKAPAESKDSSVD